MFVREPSAAGWMRLTASPPAGQKAGFWSTCVMFFTNPVLLRLALACGCDTQFVTYGISQPRLLFLMREEGHDALDVALYALLIGISTVARHLMSAG